MMEYVNLMLSVIAIIISIISLVWTINNSKAKLVFTRTHISNWNKNQLVLYSIIRNTSNKDMTLEEVRIYWKKTKRKEYDITSFLKRGLPKTIEKNKSSKLEIAFDSDGLGKLEELEKAKIILNTTFRNFEKIVDLNLISYRKTDTISKK